MSEGLLVFYGALALVAIFEIEKALKSSGGGGNSGGGTNSGGGNTPPNMTPLPFEHAPVPPVAGAYACPKLPGQYFVPQVTWNYKGRTAGPTDIMVSDFYVDAYDKGTTPFKWGGYNYWFRQVYVADTCGTKPSF